MNYLKKSVKAYVLALVFLTITNVANAASAWCQTQVSNLFIEANGSVQLTAAVRADYLQICNITTTWKGVLPTTCASWVGLMRSAVARSANVILFYDNVPSCSTIPSYANAPAPGYVMLQN